MAKKLRIIVFYPKDRTAFGDAIARRLEMGGGDAAGLDIQADTWEKPEFFADAKFPLNQFIRRLHSYDGAVLVLGPGERTQRFSWRRVREINSNVLIEIGACMARFGRRRTFLLKPDSIKLPTYFREKNVFVEDYDDTADAAQEMPRAAPKIIAELESLNTAAYYSDLPAFGLAHGYFNNFLKSVIENVNELTPIPVEGAERRFASARFVIPYAAKQILTQQQVTAHLKSIGLIEITIPAQTGRAKTVFTLPGRAEDKRLCVVDVPTNLIPIRDAIETVERLWTEEADTDAEYKSLLEEREISNFFRYLEILSEKEKPAGGTFEPFEIPNLEALTREAIEARLT